MMQTLFPVNLSIKFSNMTNLVKSSVAGNEADVRTLAEGTPERVEGVYFNPLERFQIQEEAKRLSLA